MRPNSPTNACWPFPPEENVDFKIDENLPVEVSTILCEAGHSALSVLDQHLGGRPDEAIASVCKAESRILVTLDTDFANILAYPPKDFPGIIVIRIDDQSKSSVLPLIRKIAQVLASESPSRCLWIVEPACIRIRK